MYPRLNIMFAAPQIIKVVCSNQIMIVVLRFIYLYLDESNYNNVSKIEHHVCSSSNHKGCMFKSSHLETFCMCSVEKVCQLECYEDNQNVFTC